MGQAGKLVCSPNYFACTFFPCLTPLVPFTSTRYWGRSSTYQSKDLSLRHPDNGQWKGQVQGHLLLVSQVVWSTQCRVFGIGNPTKVVSTSLGPRAG